MKIEVIASTLDPAGMNIASHLKGMYPVTIIDESPVRIENYKSNADVLIFATKHDSVSGIPSFCVHTQGNWGVAKMGGQPRTVANCPVVLKNLLYRNLVTNEAKTDYDIVNEATHHGPVNDKPCVFIEIGSSKNEWEIEQNGEIIARTILETIAQYKGEISETPVYFGIGGPHTCTNFNRLAASGDILLGHVCPNHSILDLTPQLLHHALNQHTIKPAIVLDWKSLNAQQRQHILNVLKMANVDFSKLKQLKKQFSS